MKSLRRFDIRERYYFITNVTFNREQLLLNDIDLFWRSWEATELDAWVIMNDHFHIVLHITDKSVSELMHRFKVLYSMEYRKRYRPSRVWQNRFWDHIIRNQDDYNKHLNYIHFNPVKHGIITNPLAYEYSSFGQYVKLGYYDQYGIDNLGPEIEGAFGE